MGTLLKYLVMGCLWTAVFFVSYQGMASKKEEQLTRIHETISHVQDWSSYRSHQQMLADGERMLQLESVIKSDPDLIWVDSKSKLTDTEDFHFETYFGSDVILVHMFSSETWKRIDYTHPVAGELQGSKEPIKFWLRLLGQTKSIQNVNEGTGEPYIELELKPFRNDIYGVHFEDVQFATMKVWMQEDGPREVKRMLLHVEFKPSIARLYNKLDYQIEFSDINQPMEIQVPTEGANAPKLT